MPEPRPRVNIATMTAMSSAMSGVPSRSKTWRTVLVLSEMKMSTRALPIIRATGSRTLNSVTPKDGRVDASRVVSTS